jgi:chromosome segregation ATPase
MTDTPPYHRVGMTRQRGHTNGGGRKGTDEPSDALGRLTVTLTDIEAREAEVSRRVRELERELADVRLEAASATAMLVLRERHLQERAEREARVRRDLRIAKGDLRATRIHLLEQAEGAARDARRVRVLEAETVQLEAERDASAQRLATRESQFGDLESRVKKLEKERRLLQARSNRLEMFMTSRAYRFIRLTWRVRSILGRPFRALRRKPRDAR